jgi:hypothetical protein
MATARGVDVTDLDNEFRHETRRYRGHVYVIRELPMSDYQKAVRAATNTEKDTVTGEDNEKFDADLHTAIMLGKCVTIDGKKTTADALYEKGTALVRQLQRDVSSMHFDEEKPEELEEDEAAPGEAPAS